MALLESKSWLRLRVEKAVAKGLTRAYSTVQVDPQKFLMQLRTAYRLPISGYHGVFSLEVGELDMVADDLIRGGMLSPEMNTFLEYAVTARKNVIISGTARTSGATT